eukprot:512143-Heterocapsa_arctica.AAC.1
MPSQLQQACLPELVEGSSSSHLDQGIGFASGLHHHLVAVEEVPALQPDRQGRPPSEGEGLHMVLVEDGHVHEVGELAGEVVDVFVVPDLHHRDAHQASTSNSAEADEPLAHLELLVGHHQLATGAEHRQPRPRGSLPTVVLGTMPHQGDVLGIPVRHQGGRRVVRGLGGGADNILVSLRQCLRLRPKEPSDRAVLQAPRHHLPRPLDRLEAMLATVHLPLDQIGPEGLATGGLVEAGVRFGNSSLSNPILHQLRLCDASQLLLQEARQLGRDLIE